MPIFEYRCGDCSSRFEKIVFRETEALECPACGSRHLEKQISSFAVQAAGQARPAEAGPCPCGAAQRGMCERAGDFS